MTEETEAVASVSPPPELGDGFDPTSCRLSMPFEVRLPLALTASSISGFALGAIHGGTMAGLRFRAEHAHILPETPTDWYFYHKSKNYHAMWGGLKEGFKMAGKISFWVGFYFSAEEAVDLSRGGSQDFLSSVMAGLGTAGAFSLWNRFPMHTAARTAKLGLKFGLAFGILQDAVGVLRGRKPGYVRFLTALPDRWQRNSSGG